VDEIGGDAGQLGNGYNGYTTPLLLLTYRGSHDTAKLLLDSAADPLISEDFFSPSSIVCSSANAV
jgi:hypothetical protein